MGEFVLVEVFIRAKSLAANVANEVSVFAVNENVVVEPLAVGHDFPAVVANVFPLNWKEELGKMKMMITVMIMPIIIDDVDLVRQVSPSSGV